jgi:hypothetical protein
MRPKRGRTTTTTSTTKITTKERKHIYERSFRVIEL